MHCVSRGEGRGDKCTVLAEEREGMINALC